MLKWNWNQQFTTMVLEGKYIVSVKSGQDFFCALASSGRLYTWGSSTYGRLGHGVSTGRNQATPLLVEDLKDKVIVQIACGAAHCLVLTGNIFIYIYILIFLNQTN